MAEDKIAAVTYSKQGRTSKLACDTLVSSVPLPLLGRLAYGRGDAEFNRAAEGMQFRHLVLVYVFLKRPRVMEDQWVFFPQRDVIFSRLFEQKQMNPELGPANRTAITADFTADEDSALWQSSDEELAQRVVDGLIKIGWVNADEVEGHLVVRRRNFYPRYDLAYADKMKLVSDKLREVPNLLTTGRIGMYNYNNSDHCADMGRFIAEHLAAGEAPPEIWRALEVRVADYKIVD
jgi:protoporphyrinogen oxidase